ncbi:MAG: DJ-1/PfpI family protein [Bdellovibrionota bacterium]
MVVNLSFLRCHHLIILMSLIERRALKYPTGVFLREFTDVYQEVLKAGCKAVFATPDGQLPTWDANSMEEIWAYYPYLEFKDKGAVMVDNALKLALKAFGKLLFSDDVKWKKETGLERLSPETKELVEKYSNLSKSSEDVNVFSFEDINSRLSGAGGFPYAGLFIPGGHVPVQETVNPDRSKLWSELLDGFLDANRPIGAICHGPDVLSTNNRFKKFNMTAVLQSGEEFLQSAGPLSGHTVDHYVDKNLLGKGYSVFQHPILGFPLIMTSEQLLTGQNPASAPFIGKSFVESLKLASGSDYKNDWWRGRRGIYEMPSDKLDKQNVLAQKVKSIFSEAIRSTDNDTLIARAVTGIRKKIFGENLFTSLNGIRFLQAIPQLVLHEKNKMMLRSEKYSGAEEFEVYRTGMPDLSWHLPQHSAKLKNLVADVTNTGTDFYTYKPYFDDFFFEKRRF